MKAERKRYNSNGSSVDSEPASPTVRMSRPGKKLVFLVSDLDEFKNVFQWEDHQE